MFGGAGQLARNYKTFEHNIKLRTRETIAKIKRERTSATIIAVTGSSAKTTTVALLSHILAGNSKVASQFLCNGYGHAIDALLNLRSDTRYAVIEQGTKKSGQIPQAAKLLKPDVAIITLVAVEHYTAFRSIEAVAEEKSALVEAVSDDGLVVLNFDNPHVRSMADLTRARAVTFGTTGGDYIATNIQTDASGLLSLTLTGGGHTIDLQTQLLGAHNWLTIAAAATSALELGVPPETVRGRIASFEPIRERMSPHMCSDGTRIILYGAPTTASFYLWKRLGPSPLRRSGSSWDRSAITQATLRKSTRTPTLPPPKLRMRFAMSDRGLIRHVRLRQTSIAGNFAPSPISNPSPRISGQQPLRARSSS